MKRLCCLLLTLCLILPFSLAAAEVSKEEVIYATLDASGEVNALYAVNVFTLNEQAEIVDYGSYSAVKSLTSLAIPQYDGEAVRLSGEAGRLYIQGDMRSRALPWRISLSYTLNGEAAAPEALAGASGHIGITLDIAKNEEAAGAYYDNLMCQVTLTLPLSRCKNISAQNAVSANAGEDRTLAFSALPGQGLHSEITFDAEDFQMSGVSIAALPFAMDFSLPDLSGYTEQLTTLQTTIATLSAGAEELGSALGALKPTAAALSAASEDDAASTALLDKAAALKASSTPETAALLDELTAALSEKQAALDASRADAKTLSDGLTALDQKLFSLRMTAALLARGTADLPAQIEGMAQQIKREYDYSDYRPVSFTDERNGEVALLQFVMTTAPIRVTPPAAEVTPEPEETLLTRLFKLFE